MCKKGLIVRHLRIIYANFLKNKAFKIVKYIVDTMFQKLKYYPVKFTERANMRLSFAQSKSNMDAEITCTTKYFPNSSGLVLEKKLYISSFSS